MIKTSMKKYKDKQMKLTIETIKQLIKEELQYITEAPLEPVEHKRGDAFANVEGWDHQNHQKLYQVFTEEMVPKDLKIVEVCAKTLSHLYAAKQIHFTKWSAQDHKILETGDCSNRKEFEFDQSDSFNQRFEIYSAELGFDAFPDRFKTSYDAGLSILFTEEDADIMAADMNFPADKAPNIPELSDFRSTGNIWEHARDYYRRWGHVVNAPSLIIPLVYENKPVKNCSNKPLGIKSIFAHFKMKREPEYATGNDGEKKVLMRATNKIDTLWLELNIVEI